MKNICITSYIIFVRLSNNIENVSESQHTNLYILDKSSSNLENLNNNIRTNFKTIRDEIENIEVITKKQKTNDNEHTNNDTCKFINLESETCSEKLPQDTSIIDLQRHSVTFCNFQKEKSMEKTILKNQNQDFLLKETILPSTSHSYSEKNSSKCKSQSKHELLSNETEKDQTGSKNKSYLNNFTIDNILGSINYSKTSPNNSTLDINDKQSEYNPINITMQPKNNTFLKIISNNHLPDELNIIQKKNTNSENLP